MEIFKVNNIKGWRRNYNVNGHPDFVFLKKKVAIFVDGCFWHGHECRNIHPSNNSEYWQRKLNANIRHDMVVTKLFVSRGWKVLRIWECQLKKANIQNTINRITQSLDL